MGNCWQRNAMKSNQKIKYHKTRTAKPVKNLAQDNWNLALEYFHAGRFTEAETAIESFLSQNPTHADAWNLSGLIQRGLIQYEKAVEHIETAVRLDTNKCFYLNNLGAIYKDMRQLDKSFQALEKALSIQPDYLEAVYNMGCTLQAKGELIRAGQYYEKALSLKPDYANAQGNLTGIYKDQGEMEEALGACLKTLSLRPSDSYAYSNYIFCLNYLENIPAKDIFEKHLDWNRTFGTESVQPVSSHPNDPKPDRRLRIGYVSPDLNWHSVAFFLLPILQQTDHSGFEIFCYSNSDKTDLATDLMKQASHHWRIIFRQTDEDAAAQILADQIDILIDLAGHSGRNRMTLFAKKPAPVQITYLGYPNTTGCPAVDYRITDEWTDPSGRADSLYTEKLVRLPDGFLCYSPPTDLPDVQNSPCIHNGFITFGSFSNRAKITKNTIEIWATILKRVSNSRLLLKSSIMGDQDARKRLLDQFVQNGISPDRIDILGYMPLQDHFSAYQQMDVALDTFPYNGTTTTCEALWMGVPVITLNGDRHAGRVSGSILSRIGLSDWIADSTGNYIETAVQMTRHPDHLQKLRMTMRSRMLQSPLMNRRGFVQNLETAYRWMWKGWCEHEKKKRSLEWIFILGMAHAGSGWIRHAVQEILAVSGSGQTIYDLGRVADLETFFQNHSPQTKQDGDVRLIELDEMTRAALPLLTSGQAIGLYACRDIRNAIACQMKETHQTVADLVESNELATMLTKDEAWRQHENVIAVKYDDIIKNPASVIQHIAIQLGHPVDAPLAGQIAAQILCHTGSDDNHHYGDTMNMEEMTLLNQIVKNSVIAGGYDHPDVMDVAVKGGITLSVPTDMNLLTPYVLLEQGDWFEEETELVRNIIQTGDHVVDIGAKYGAYSLLAGKAVGVDGKVWAFEQQTATAAYLSRSILMNGMDQVDLVSVERAETERKPISLDRAMNRFFWPVIDFVKIDAEGQEEVILNNSHVFLSIHSPLVLYRIKYNETVNLNLIHHFKSLGYDSYRLVSGLGCLVPCLPDGIDSYQLSLFCCKPDRAAGLEKRGLLIRQEFDTETVGQTDPALWIDHVEAFPYALRLLPMWQKYLVENQSDTHWRNHQEALSCYAVSRMIHIDPANRLYALNRAYLLLKNMIKHHATFSRLMSFVRVTLDLGFRAQAVRTLDHLIHMMESGQNVSIDEPFIPVSAGFEARDPEKEIGAWCLVSLLETRERYQSFSTYFTGDASLENLEFLRTLPFYHPDMEQRRKVIRMRYGLQD